MHNLTYQERARFAYAAGNDELAEALEQLAEWDRLTDEQTDYIEELEQELADLQAALRTITESAPLFADESTDWQAEHNKVRAYAKKVLQP